MECYIIKIYVCYSMCLQCCGDFTPVNTSQGAFIFEFQFMYRHMPGKNSVEFANANVLSVVGKLSH